MKILLIGAHPDDCDIYGGGFALLHKKQGNQVKFISVTNKSTVNLLVESKKATAIRKKNSVPFLKNCRIFFHLWIFVTSL